MSTNDTLRGLLPCPFCGGKHPLLSKYRNSDPVGTLIGYVWRVECESCGANTCLGIERTEEQAVSTWNCRAPLPAVEAAEIEVVRYGLRGGDGDCNCMNCTAEMQSQPNGEYVRYDDHRRILAGVNQQAGGGWVACADRMPEGVADVLVYCDDTKEQFVAFRARNGAFQFAQQQDGTSIVCRPNYWQPLPPSPAAKAVGNE